MNSLNSSGGYPFKGHKQEITISCSPHQGDILTSSRLRIFCSRGTSSVQLPCMIDWKRVHGSSQEYLPQAEGCSYECSPMDAGCIIEAFIRCDDEGVQYEAVRRFGPVKLDSELVNSERSNRHEIYRTKLLIQNMMIDLSIRFQDEAMVLISKQSAELKLRLMNMPEVHLRQDTRIAILKMKSAQDSLSAYFGSVLRKVLKNKIQMLEFIFECRSKRDLFLYALQNLTKRRSSGSHLGKPTIKQDGSGYNRQKQLQLDASKIRKNSDNCLMPQPKRQRTHVEKDKLLVIKEKVLPLTKSISNTQQHTHSTNPKHEYLNIFNEQQSNFLREFQNRELSGDLPSHRQHALNLRQSFKQLQQKHINTRSRKDLKLSSEDTAKQTRELRQSLEQARNQINKLHIEIAELRQENSSLKNLLNNSGNSKEILQIKQKIQYLTADNQRLETERAQIISDKLAAEMKFQKQRQEKQMLKSKLQTMGVNMSGNNLPIPPKQAERRQARSPYSNSNGDTKIENSRSTKDIKQRKESGVKNISANVNMPILLNPNESPTHRRQPIQRRLQPQYEVPLRDN